ncbi:3,4-dihydroxy-2-butanone-4-phosphate synthase [Synchytrium endobioticum]|nr:3,4-dihydroxy-2-butanone-4-phosphate synthase [Synchytrium endobioticum]
MYSEAEAETDSPPSSYIIAASSYHPHTDHDKCHPNGTTIQEHIMSKYYKNVNVPPLYSSIQSNSHDHEFDSIEDAIEAIKTGTFIIAVDNEDRENEGDLIIAAENMNTQKMAFMLRYTGGVVCVPAPGDVLDRLNLPLMVKYNEESLRTAYTITCDAVAGTTTGISASDRAATCVTLADPSAVSSDLRRPGHVFPLRYHPGGVLKRVGHTEASVDICKLAGKSPVSVISELMLDDGRMMRRDDIKLFAKKWGLRVITISDLVNYRIRNGLTDENCEMCPNQIIGPANRDEISVQLMNTYTKVRHHSEQERLSPSCNIDPVNKILARPSRPASTTNVRKDTSDFYAARNGRGQSITGAMSVVLNTGLLIDALAKQPYHEHFSRYSF